MEDKLKIILSDDKKKTAKGSDIPSKLAKIKKLTTELETLKKKVGEIKSFVDEKTKDSMQKMFEIKEGLVLSLIDKYQLKGFTVQQKKAIEDMIFEEVDLLRDFNYSTEKLDTILKGFLSSQISGLNPKEKKLTNDLMKGFFDKIGLDIDIDIENMGNKEFQEKLKEEYINNQNKEQEKLKHKDAKHKNNTIDFDFQKLYKKLAKIAHPDLSKNESEVHVKENQMKRLVTAWDERNYYELLTLWIEIDPKNTIGLEKDDVNIKSIVAQLNAKIRHLENEKHIIKNVDEESSFYYQNFYTSSEQKILDSIDKYILEIDGTIIETQELDELLKDTKAFKNYLKEKQEAESLDFLFDEDLFDVLWSGSKK